MGGKQAQFQICKADRGERAIVYSHKGQRAKFMDQSMKKLLSKLFRFFQ